MLRLFSALAIAESSSFSTTGAAAFGVYIRIASASSTFLPRIRSMTIFTLLEEMRT